MTSLAQRAALPLAVLASVVLLAGCGGSSKSAAAQSDSGGVDTSSAIYQKECKAMQPIFSDANVPASARDPEKIISQFQSGPGWGVLTKQQQTDAVAGIRKAATGSCD
jgi:ABC-type glycerol-3-phosphate transport system substrate-binding protein